MKKILINTIKHWSSHNAPRMGAALSYYAMLALVPLLALIIAAVALFFGKEIAEHAVINKLTDFLGNNAAQYINELLKNADLQKMDTRAAIVGAITFAVGTLGMFTELDKDLDELWETSNKKTKPVKSLFKKIKKIISEKISLLLMIPILSILLLASISITLFLSLFHFETGILSFLGGFLSILQVLLPFIISVVLFALIYRIFPNLKLPWKTLFLGAVLTSTLFMIGNILIGVYLNYIVNVNTFGSASSLVGILIWIYYSSQVFFLGASFTYVYADQKNVIPARD